MRNMVLDVMHRARERLARKRLCQFVRHRCTLAPVADAVEQQARVWTLFQREAHFLGEIAPSGRC